MYLDGIQPGEGFETAVDSEFVLFVVGEKLSELFVETPQGEDFPETGSKVHGLVGRKRSAFPPVCRVARPEDGRQLRADVQPFVAQIDALKKAAVRKCGMSGQKSAIHGTYPDPWVRGGRGQPRCGGKGNVHRRTAPPCTT